MSKKALVAMSGGVDSSVAAWLMKRQGFDCIGVTLKLFSNDDIIQGGDKPCCSLEDVEDARSVADRLDMPHYVFNFAADFKTSVIDRFVAAYQNGATPNPCIDCNRHIKFEKLLARARQLGLDRLATGHYARIEKAGGRCLLKKAADEAKDQSYVLYGLTQEQLEHILFPLGGLHKSEARAIAEEQGFVVAHKRESQDICFVRDGDYAGFIERYTGKMYESGDFMDLEGHPLGRHRGLIRYTVGQRKGLGLALKRPMYVRSKNLAGNTVTLCEDAGLFAKSLEAVDFNWIAGDRAERPLRVEAKIRYRQAGQRATAEQVSPDTVRVEFDEPQRAIAPGQAVVLYDGDTVIGGGTILSAS